MTSRTDPTRRAPALDPDPARTRRPPAVPRHPWAACRPRGGGLRRALAALAWAATAACALVAGGWPAAAAEVASLLEPRAAPFPATAPHTAASGRTLPPMGSGSPADPGRTPEVRKEHAQAQRIIDRLCRGCD
ncbi:hypothetical protein OPKNFCMD_6467 [Methylobacterium crusticola]|uniref:Uncharacterized protein n=1 Tax=Methylobacterium crusticola TaxID=1697972 RepID=A0ABQ4R954_9HYPH|nr:hypothetical protein [Methylobacterium crusticola]GJD53690.1 hypothetical protein OPKNFCMD_6467 [Methylobacterium crusticola]